MRPGPLLFAAALLSLARPAGAERLVPAYDPSLHVRPPTMKGVDGQGGELRLDADFLERAARFRRANPGFLQAAGDVSLAGEVIVVQGDDGTLVSDGSGFGMTQQNLANLARKVIARFGDHFHAITVWQTFTDRADARNAEAYEVPIKNDVHGLGPRLPILDRSGNFGSRGVLRSILNMKLVGLAVRGDGPEAWRAALETWGQESSHRWMMFMLFRDPRTGRLSDALLGRDCAHYSRFVDSQASVHDGFAWRDNGDGTFTWTEAMQRYGNLDLYGMGLLAPDEVPPFFIIEDIPGFPSPTSCQDYPRTARPPQRTISGRRVDVTIADIIAANGERLPPADERQDYWREAQVVVTTPGESLESPRVATLVDRLNKARLYWEQWNRQASRNRLVICTQVTADCGDARSDVTRFVFNAAARPPGAGPLAFEVEVSNRGVRPATGVKATLEVTVGEEVRRETKDLGTLEPGAVRPLAFDVDLRGVRCGTEVQAKVFTQSDFHHSRKRAALLVGAERKISDDFESDTGWTINPDGDDSLTGAEWERGQPEQTDLRGRPVQPGGAHTGQSAWVTGLAATARGGRATRVREGKATLQSPLYDLAGLREPALRYWVSFAGVRTVSGPTGVEASDQSRLAVLARGVQMTAEGPTAATEWTEIDAIEDRVSTRWEQRTIRLPDDLVAAGRLQLRFVASDSNPGQGGLEVAIDDLEIHSNLPACYQTAAIADDGGCDCELGGRGRAPGAAGALALAALLLVRRRRRPRATCGRPTA